MSICFVVVFNHKYEKNVEKLEQYYRDKFSSRFYLIPFYEGSNSKVISVYDNSTRFQNYFQQGLSRFYNEKHTHYVFIADDLLLNPIINEENIYELLGLGEKYGYIKRAFTLHNLNWFWPHVLNGLNAFSTPGVEFRNEIPSYEEALYLFKKHNIDFGDCIIQKITKKLYADKGHHFKNDKLPYPIVGGYSDLVIVPKASINKFCHYCGIFASMNLFVEISIPTALLLSCDNVLFENKLFPGVEFWNGEEIKLKEECNGVVSRIFSIYPKTLYFHPIKLSQWEISNELNMANHKQTKENLRISVVVCTHNRCNDLMRTLDSLASQDYPTSDYEVVVVDNRSMDRTKDVVDEFIRKYPPMPPLETRGGIRKDDDAVNVRYIFEEKIGLSHARNRGIAESRGNIVAFIDDDAIAEKTWLSELQKAYDKNKEAMCVGGRVILKWIGVRPSWWKKEMDPLLSAVDYGDSLKKLTYPVYPYGTNISFRRSIFEKSGLFNPELGRIGKRLLAGEEIEICLNIEQNGGGIYYSPDALVQHVIESARITKKLINKRAYWHGRSFAMLEIRHFRRRRVFRRAGYMIRQIVFSLHRAWKDMNSLSMIYYRLGYIRQAGMLMVHGICTKRLN